MADQQLDVPQQPVPVHNNDGGYRTFASVERPAMGDDQGLVAEWELPVGPVTLRGTNTIDPKTLDAGYTLSVRIPLMSEVRLGSGRGNLKDGITNRFGVAGIIEGTATQYIKNTNEVWLTFEITVFGNGYKGDTRLFNLPS